MSKDILTFPLSFFPTAAEISLSLEAGRAQLGQAEEEEAMVKTASWPWSTPLICLWSGSSTSSCLRRDKEECVS